MYPEKRPNADRSDSLAARLRALPPPAVPAGLEARLLAAVPVHVPVKRRRRPFWVAAVCVLAAACLLAVLLWPRLESGKSAPGPPIDQALNKGMPMDFPNNSGLLSARRDLEETDIPTFSWPLEEKSPMTLSLSIPDGLLD